MIMHEKVLDTLADIGYDLGDILAAEREATRGRAAVTSEMLAECRRLLGIADTCREQALDYLREHLPGDGEVVELAIDFAVQAEGLHRRLSAMSVA